MPFSPWMQSCAVCMCRPDPATSELLWQAASSGGSRGSSCMTTLVAHGSEQPESIQCMAWTRLWLPGARKELQRSLRSAGLPDIFYASLSSWCGHSVVRIRVLRHAISGCQVGVQIVGSPIATSIMVINRDFPQSLWTRVLSYAGFPAACRSALISYGFLHQFEDMPCTMAATVEGANHLLGSDATKREELVKTLK